jgi:hypothetical protein
MISGLIDAGNLTDCLVGIQEGRAGTEILDKNDEVRRDIYQRIINPLSTCALERQWIANPTKLVESDLYVRKVAKALSHEDLALELQL